MKMKLRIGVLEAKVPQVEVVLCCQFWSNIVYSSCCRTPRSCVSEAICAI